VALLGTSNGVPEMEGSVGGNLAYSSDVQAVCDWFGPTNFLTFDQYPNHHNPDDPNSPLVLLIGGFLKDKQDEAWAASPIKYITGDEPPFLIHHGTADMTVPFHQSVELDSALKSVSTDVTFTPLEGAGHGGAQFAEQEIWDEVVAFFTRTLRGTVGVEAVPASTPELFSIDIYPTPVGSTATITFNGNGSAVVSYVLTNVAGMEIVSGSTSVGSTLSLQTAAFPEGLYYLNASSGAWQQTRPLVITR